MRLRYRFDPADPVVVHESGACYLQVTWIDEDTGDIVMIDQVHAPYLPFYSDEESERYIRAVLIERAKELERRGGSEPPQLRILKDRLAGRTFRVDTAENRVAEIVEKEVDHAAPPSHPRPGATS